MAISEIPSKVTFSAVCLFLGANLKCKFGARPLGPQILAQLAYIWAHTYEYVDF